MTKVGNIKRNSYLPLLLMRDHSFIYSFTCKHVLCQHHRLEMVLAVRVSSLEGDIQELV